MRRSTGTSLLLASAFAISCNRPNPVGPSQSTTPAAATIQRLSVSGLREALAVGDAVQLHAFAEYSNGERQDVTGTARWSSKTLNCLVTASGALSAREAGPCLVAAAYSGASGTAETQVQPARVFTLEGTVRDAWEVNEPVLPHATVTLTTGLQAGRSVTTDANGWFEITGVPNGPVSVRADAHGLEPQTTEASPERRSIAFALTAPVETVSWKRTTSTYSETFWTQIPFQMRHRGPVVITLTTTAQSDYCGTYENFSVGVAGPISDLKWDDRPAPRCGGTATLRGTGPAGSYQLSIFLRSAPLGTRELTLTHPR